MKLKTLLRQYLSEQSLESVKMNDAFFKWFGDSKVVDNTGNPMICYHGTDKGGFEKFEPKVGYKGKSKQQADFGSHFSGDKDYATGYAKNKKTSKVYEVFLKIENPLYTNKLFFIEDDETEFLKYFKFVTKTFNMKKLRPEAFYDKNGDRQTDPQNIMLNSFLVDSIPSNKLYNAINESDFDGMFHYPYNKVGLSHIKNHPAAYIILKPNQVKSINNDGSWDSNDDNIAS